MRIDEGFGNEAALGVDLVLAPDREGLAGAGDASVVDGDVEELVALVPQA